MKIIVNYIAADSGGALTILNDFYSFIKEDVNLKNLDWVFMLSDKYLEETENIKIDIFQDIKKSWLKRLKFDLFTGRKYIENQDADLLINFQNTCIFGARIPQILYVHQAIPFQSVKKFSFIKKNERKLFVYQYIIGFLIKNSIRRANHIIVQSNWMKNYICEHEDVSSLNISVIRPNINFDNINEMKCNNRNNNVSNIFFYPAANYIYKNHEIIYKAVKELNRRNITDFKVYLTINDDGKKYDNIKFIGRIRRDEVFDFYKKSILIFPSYIETYGLPLAEAEIFNTLILAANCCYSKEVLKSYKNVLYFDPFNYKELADLMENIIKLNITKTNNEYKLNTDNKIPDWIKLNGILEKYIYKEG